MANKVYVAEETAITWQASGGTYTLDLGTTGGDADGVRIGARGDLGASSRASRYKWRMYIDGFDAAPTVGESVQIYLSTSDGTNADGGAATTDSNGTTPPLENMLHIGKCTVETTTAGDNIIASGIVELLDRYVSPVIHNDTAVKLLSTADAHVFSLTPMPPEAQ